MWLFQVSYLSRKRSCQCSDSHRVSMCSFLLLQSCFPLTSSTFAVASLRSHHPAAPAALPRQCSGAGRRNTGWRYHPPRTSSIAFTRRLMPPQGATWVCRCSGRASSTTWRGHAPWWTPPWSQTLNLDPERLDVESQLFISYSWAVWIVSRSNLRSSGYDL